MKRIIPILLFSIFFTGCGKGVSADDEKVIHGLVEEIVHNAEVNNIEYFMALQRESNKESAQYLIEMVNKSGMLSNYKKRLSVTEDSARLNYHYLEKGCHFQVGLKKIEGVWKISGIGICR